MKWYDDLPDIAQGAVDQTLHFVAGFAFSALGGPIVSVVVVLIRELVQNWGDSDNDYLDMAIDILVWGLGAALASLVF